MSIQELIRDCLARDDLFLLDTFDPSIPRVRFIYVSQTVKEFTENPTNARAGRLHANLDLFIGGGVITASMAPHKAGNAYMGRLNPPEDGIWDIRSRDPSPALRLLGGFSKRDVFIGLVLRERKSLGDKKSREWSVAISECNKEWRNRFLAYKPLCGDNLHDYLSNCTSVV